MVESFYDALFKKDGEQVAALIDEHFAPDAVLWRPESLPGGGRTEGAERIKRFMVGATKLSGPPLDVADMKVVSITEGEGRVAVELAFPFAGIDAGALELWTVADGQVTRVRAYYWDTAAMLKAVGA
jgi:ketosteroid isomerase-like protein